MPYTKRVRKLVLPNNHDIIIHMVKLLQTSMKQVGDHYEHG